MTFFTLMSVSLNHQTVYMKIKQYIEIDYFITEYFKILRFGVFLVKMQQFIVSGALGSEKTPDI